jgi:hypothetical protein
MFRDTEARIIETNNSKNLFVSSEDSIISTAFEKLPLAIWATEKASWAKENNVEE